MLEKCRRIIAVVGHYGSGKTNLAVNLAVDLKAAGKQVVLVDLDIVNPYFRSADFAGLMQEKGIETILPVYARSNLDIPALTAQLDGAIDTGKTLVIDVGGDDAGAAALGRYSHAIREAGGCDLLCVVNQYRYLTRTPEQADEILEQIQAASRMQVTGVVNNSNLAYETSAEDVLATIPFAQQVADRYRVPLVFTTVRRDLFQAAKQADVHREFYPVDIYVKKIWEE